jgi:hypothetical protein
VTDILGTPVSGVSVSVQVDDPGGGQVSFTTNIQTDAAGVFQTSSKLNSNAVAGTYSVFASSNKPGYTSATIHRTFVVVPTSTPSVIITQVYTANMTGNPVGEFSLGQTALIWVVVQNKGATFQGVIWIQVLDPTGSPQWIQVQTSTINSGSSVKIASSNLPIGVYKANALASDKPISQGGAFLTGANT